MPARRFSLIDPGDDRVVVADAVAGAGKDLARRSLLPTMRDKDAVAVEGGPFVRGGVAHPA